MKKRLFVLLAVAFVNISFIVSARADAPVSISLYNPLQIIHEDDNVKGLRVNLIYGANVDVSGIDVGIVNRTYGTQKGFQMGLFNDTANFHGLQFGLVNKAYHLEGVQLGLINIHYSEKPDGFVPFINWKF